MSVEERIRTDILSGSFEEGFTREVAERYGVTTATARRALTNLAEEFEE